MKSTPISATSLTNRNKAKGAASAAPFFLQKQEFLIKKTKLNRRFVFIFRLKMLCYWRWRYDMNFEMEKIGRFIAGLRKEN
ncbi:MAG: hypothetical protein IKM38_08345, partial [Christensenellaceae bacterium]|nr:hypothetical protein [Christensenellaceae bacterium]